MFRAATATTYSRTLMNAAAAAPPPAAAVKGHERATPTLVQTSNEVRIIPCARWSVSRLLARQIANLHFDIFENIYRLHLHEGKTGTTPHAGPRAQAGTKKKESTKHFSRCEISTALGKNAACTRTAELLKKNTGGTKRTKQIASSQQNAFSNFQPL